MPRRSAKNPHLGRRPLQFHQCRRRAGELSVAEPALLPLGAVALHTAGFHRAGDEAPHRLSRKTLGQLFCDESSQQIIDMLLDECSRGGVQLLHPLRVERIARGDSRPRSTLERPAGNCTRRAW
jgi:hypothetical protein